ncbi:MAG: hypothetical protein U0736_18515 [Gemmataceae bacterium]
MDKTDGRHKVMLPAGGLSNPVIAGGVAHVIACSWAIAASALARFVLDEATGSNCGSAAHRHRQHRL